MGLNLRAVPGLLALAGLAIPIAGGALVAWPFLVAVVLVVAAAAALAAVRDHPARVLRHGGGLLVGLAIVPVLLVTGWQGGWWLVPADVAWLTIEIADGRKRAADSSERATGPGEPEP